MEILRKSGIEAIVQKYSDITSFGYSRVYNAISAFFGNSVLRISPFGNFELKISEWDFFFGIYSRTQDKSGHK